MPDVRPVRGTEILAEDVGIERPVVAHRGKGGPRPAPHAALRVVIEEYAASRVVDANVVDDPAVAVVETVRRRALDVAVEYETERDGAGVQRVLRRVEPFGDDRV